MQANYLPSNINIEAYFADGTGNSHDVVDKCKKLIYYLTHGDLILPMSEACKAVPPNLIECDRQGQGIGAVA